VQRCPRCTHLAFATDRFCLHCGRPFRSAARRWLVGGLLLLTCLLGARAGAPSLLAAATPSAASPTVAAPTPVRVAAPPGCRFTLGFKTLHDLLPARVGACRDDEQFQPLSAEAVQHTSGGLLVWRKADNGTAFTDGSQTWLLGPYGLQQRPNNRRFAWESNRQHLPVLP
jgi:hypothetical protein